MKKITLFLLGTIIFCFSSFAQDEKYTMAMQEKVVAVDTVRKTDDLIALSASFERIADAEKTKWLPYYYAALTQVNAAYYLGEADMKKAEQTDPMADRAETLINKAEELSANNSEIFIVKKMIATLRMMPGEMDRYMKYGPVAEKALQTAMKLNPENPRVYLLQAQDKFYTPEQYGGSKEEAKKLLEVANKKYEVFKPVSNLDPDWGRGTVQYFLAQINK
jgi:hypothetical protein